MSPAGLAETAVAAREQVVAATGLVPAAELPPAEWVDRGAWIDANLATMRSTLGPVLEEATGGSQSNASGGAGPFAALQNAGGAVVAAEVGALLGFLRAVSWASTSWISPTRSRLRGCCSSVPTLTAPRASSAPTAKNWSPG